MAAQKRSHSIADYEQSYFKKITKMSNLCGGYWYKIMIKLPRKVILFWLLKVIACSFKIQENTSLPGGPCQFFVQV